MRVSGSGRFWTRNWLRRSRTKTAAQIAFLLGLGFLVVVVHVTFRIPVRLHGRHGIELMALVLVGKLSVNRRWSASTVGLGAGAFSALPFWSFRDPLMPLLFLLPGLVVDGAYHLFESWGRTMPFLLVIGALAHTTKPLLRAAAAASIGLEYGFLRDGLIYGLALHLLFGALGGLLAFLYALGTGGRAAAADP